jgi:hypothetical protein
MSESMSPATRTARSSINSAAWPWACAGCSMMRTSGPSQGICAVSAGRPVMRPNRSSGISSAISGGNPSATRAFQSGCEPQEVVRDVGHERVRDEQVEGTHQVNSVTAQRSGLVLGLSTAAHRRAGPWRSRGRWPGRQRRGSRLSLQPPSRRSGRSRQCSDGAGRRVGDLGGPEESATSRPGERALERCAVCRCSDETSPRI